MREDEVHDFHMHLNGSFSKGFLKTVAARNNVAAVYTKFQELNRQYHEESAKFDTTTQPDEVVSMLWRQFGLIHQIIQTTTDIEEGVYDVATSSDASSMLIRTTPKKFNNSSVEDYIQAFIAGINRVNNDINIQKQVAGLLSIDRTKTSEEEAYFLINQVVAQKKINGSLVGIDICGDPLAKRTITGRALFRVLTDALNKDICVTIHAGEADTDQERSDFDVSLEALSNWKQSTGKPLKNRARLGHVIWPSEEQRRIIGELGVAIEICPTCHRKVNWSKPNQKHPILQIYDSLEQPVVSGTDDSLLFGSSAKEELKALSLLFNSDSKPTIADLSKHQKQFRFF